MHGTGHADVLVVLQMLGNKADAVSCERLQKHCDSESEIKYLCFSSKVNEMGTTVSIMLEKNLFSST
jgi:hypothetical protein